jgi:hypothetical protein
MDAAFPAALDALAMGALGLGLACAALFALDRQTVSGRRSSLIWPLAAAFGALLWLLFYLREGRADVRPDSVALVLSAGAHPCGLGCRLDDVVADWLSSLAPASTQALAWGVAVALAFALGLAWLGFKGGHTPRRRTVGAASAGAASLVAWQLGMYAFLAFGQITWIVGGRV